MDFRGRSSWRMLPLGLVLMGLPGTAQAELAWFGIHASYYDNYEKVAAGVNAVEDIGKGLNVCLTGDYIFTSRSETISGSLDLQYDLPVNAPVPLWIGAGLGLDHKNPDGPAGSVVDAYGHLIAGFGFTKNRPWMPYVQGRAIFKRPVEGVLTIGVRF